MRLVERHIIQKNHRFYAEIDRLCFLSQNLYNYANYLVRQSFIFENTYRNYHDIQKTLQNQSDYQAIPGKVSQQILMIIEKNWKSFLGANEADKKTHQNLKPVLVFLDINIKSREEMWWFIRRKLLEHHVSISKSS